MTFDEVLLFKVDSYLLEERFTQDADRDRRLGLEELNEVVKHLLFKVGVQVLLYEDESHCFQDKWSVRVPFFPKRLEERRH